MCKIGKIVLGGIGTRGRILAYWAIYNIRFFKKRLPGVRWGANPGPLDFIYFLIIYITYVGHLSENNKSSHKNWQLFIQSKMYFNLFSQKMHLAKLRAFFQKLIRSPSAKSFTGTNGNPQKILFKKFRIQQFQCILCDTNEHFLLNLFSEFAFCTMNGKRCTCEFRLWAIIFFGELFPNYSSRPNLWGRYFFPQIKLCISFDKKIDWAKF
jgi:hypothetical protein